jgi:hypothetical protein
VVCRTDPSENTETILLRLEPGTMEHQVYDQDTELLLSHHSAASNERYTGHSRSRQAPATGTAYWPLEGHGMSRQVTTGHGRFETGHSRSRQVTADITIAMISDERYDLTTPVVHAVTTWHSHSVSP